MLSSCMSTKHIAVLLVVKFLAILSSSMHGWLLFPGIVLGRTVLRKTRKNWVANILKTRRSGDVFAHADVSKCLCSANPHIVCANLFPQRHVACFFFFFSPHI